MIIKATRLQAWAPAGGARVGRRPPLLENKKNVFWAILGAFLLIFLHMGAFLLRFSHFWGPFGGLFTMWGLFATFYFMVGAFLLGLPPPTKISADAHEHAPRKFFLCDRNLVSSGHVLLRFCLENNKK